MLPASRDKCLISSNEDRKIWNPFVQADGTMAVHEGENILQSVSWTTFVDSEVLKLTSAPRFCVRSSILGAGTEVSIQTYSFIFGNEHVQFINEDSIWDHDYTPNPVPFSCHQPPLRRGPHPDVVLKPSLPLKLKSFSFFINKIWDIDLRTTAVANWRFRSTHQTGDRGKD